MPRRAHAKYSARDYMCRTVRRISIAKMKKISLLKVLRAIYYEQLEHSTEAIYIPAMASSSNISFPKAPVDEK